MPARRVATNLAADGGDAGVLHDLQERVKELTALHGAARLLQDDREPLAETLARVVALIPPAWQYPEITCGRISVGGVEATSASFRTSPWRQAATVRTAAGTPITVEVFYRERMPPSKEGPFLAEERALIDSLAEIVRSFVERNEGRRALEQAHEELERRVAHRTAELQRVNEALLEEVAERQRSEDRIAFYRERLRSLAAELSSAEEDERRAIASELHDQIGQTLATIRLKLLEVQRGSAFCGYEATLGEMRSLLDGAIRSARSLTVEISPPVLYDLGLVPALEWLAEQFQERHGLAVRVDSDQNRAAGVDDTVAVTVFKAIREFLLNTVKHAGASEASILVAVADGLLVVDYSDDGVGFDPRVVDGTGSRPDIFGLFNVRERCTYLGGQARLDSVPGRGVSFTVKLPCRVGEKERRRERTRAARR